MCFLRSDSFCKKKYDLIIPIEVMDGNVNKSFASKYCLLDSISVKIAQKRLVKYFSFSGKVKYEAYHSPKVSFF